MLFYLLIILITICSCTNALVTVLCNSNDITGSLFLQAGCVLYDNGQVKLAKSNIYPITYQSGGFDDNGYHVEFYFGESSASASISTPNGSGVSMMRPAGQYPGYLYFAFKDKSVEQAANDAYYACLHMRALDALMLPCDDVRNEAVHVYNS